MKLGFSSKLVNTKSFLGLCDIAAEYNFGGFEIFDAKTEKQSHRDSILRSSSVSDSKRKLINRHISVYALTYPTPLVKNEDMTCSCVEYVNMAASAAIPYVIFRIADEEAAMQLKTAIKEAESLGVKVLIETVGIYSDTEKLIELINSFEMGAVGVCLNYAETYFNGNESAEKTIQTLGAYICHVRLGDRKNGERVLIGDGEIPIDDLMISLNSLDYDGFITLDENDITDDPDILLTHFESVMSSYTKDSTKTMPVYYNRSKTGTFPWKKYETSDLTFSQVLDTMAEYYPDQYAFKYTTLDYTRTYSEFRKDVDRAAAALISLGVGKGDHVAIWATNVPQWFLTFWAVTKIGGVVVTVNTAYKSHEAEYLLRQSDTHTLIMIESFRDSNYKEIIEELCPELKTLEKGKPLFCKRLPFLRNVVTVGFEMDGCLEWNDMLKRAVTVPQEEVRRRAAEVKPTDVCNMQYTSGTTGFPKGVMLTHLNIVNDGKIIGDRMDLSTADRMMIQVPMFHCFGMVLSMTSMMTHGGTLSPLPYYSPKSSLKCVTDEKITCFNGVPTMFIGMFNHEDFAKTDFSHVRTGIMAGSNCPPELMRRAAEEMNMTEIVSVYGQTESAPGCTMGEVNEDLDHRVETVGSAFPGVECKIIDPETGEDLPDGENGEFVARGFNIMKGYYKMPKETSGAIDKDGWLHTGDICCRTPDGYYKVTGRLKDMIIRGGENIYPREIEEFYLTHPKIKDVQVVGVPDERYGEEACAWIVLKDGFETYEQEMREYGNAHMARHKVPRYFVFVKELPMNAAGKILKYKMKEESIKMLGLKK